MTQKLLCLCAVCALLFVFATANVANAEGGAATAGCPCAFAAGPCKLANPCYPPVAYRVGWFGAVRPVVYAPVYRAPVYRPVHIAPRFYAPYYRGVACPPYYGW
jgi:hypothetical protein